MVPDTCPLAGTRPLLTLAAQVPDQLDLPHTGRINSRHFQASAPTGLQFPSVPASGNPTQWCLAPLHEPSWVPPQDIPHGLFPPCVCLAPSPTRLGPNIISQEASLLPQSRHQSHTPDGLVLHPFTCLMTFAHHRDKPCACMTLRLPHPLTSIYPCDPTLGVLRLHHHVLDKWDNGFRGPLFLTC